MAATKASSSLLAAVTTTTTSAAVDVSAHYADTVYGSIAVVGTPTVAAAVQVQESPDGGTTWYSPPTGLYSTALAAGTYYFRIPVDPTATRVQVVFTQQTGGTSSTCTVQLGEVTGI